MGRAQSDAGSGSLRWEYSTLQNRYLPPNSRHPPCYPVKPARVTGIPGNGIQSSSDRAGADCVGGFHRFTDWLKGTYRRETHTSVDNTCGPLPPRGLAVQLESRIYHDLRNPLRSIFPTRPPATATLTSEHLHICSSSRAASSRTIPLVPSAFLTPAGGPPLSSITTAKLKLCKRGHIFPLSRRSCTPSILYVSRRLTQWHATIFPAPALRINRIRSCFCSRSLPQEQSSHRLSPWRVDDAPCKAVQRATP
ncbi:hypothetical protein JB92DRAFT_2837924 [Gautieria morchelliformis]|nr:hypothetical protein JB92DRAFT_2837924 [Gautieria morchelliformis]